MLRPLLTAAFLASLSTLAWSTDVGVSGKKLVVIGGGDGTRDKLSFVAKGGAIQKGSGTDPDAIELSIDLQRGDHIGSFRIPNGVLAPAGHGWQRNDQKVARYRNVHADSGTPTFTRSALVRPGKLVKLTARGLGDTPLSLEDWLASTSSIRATTTVSNDQETHRFCTTFPAGNVSSTDPADSSRQKLVATQGRPSACPGILLSPTPHLPTAPPSAPYLYFDGSDPGALADLQSRVIDPATSGFFGSFRATTDAALASLASASDDARSKVAKASGLLHVIGETPPAGSGFATYRDVAVTAMLGMLDRTALDSVDEFLNPPPNLLDVLRDSGRLQSIAEAYDFLRGSGVSPPDDAALRTLIASWANAYVEDWNLIGDPFGVFPGHRDNWAVKGGSALVTAALALPDHPDAPVWLEAGMTYVNESLREVVMAPGWYSEGPHYVNYSLNNLASAAWHVRHATATDWFDDLAPLVDTALALRQPDGESAAFEEGVPNVFPFDVLAAAMPERAATMLWAWQQSAQAPGNYDNQQIHAVTRFLVTDRFTTPAAPTTPATIFLLGDTRAAALRSSWDADAVQITAIAALDHSSSEVFASRHNMENPLDLTLFAAGAILLPTASGGPQVTNSTNRAVYLEPGSKNVPLVDGDAPYLRDPLAAALGERLDSRDADGFPHDFLDTATLSVPTFAPGVSVERTIALIAGDYGVVLDHFEGGPAPTYGSTWRGRGSPATRSEEQDHIGVDYAYPNAAMPTAHLSIDVTASASLSAALDTGLYAPQWGVEETLSPLRVSAPGGATRILTLLRPRENGTPASTIAPLTSSAVVAFHVTRGSSEDVIASGDGTPFEVAGIQSDAHLVLVRRASGATERFSMVRGTFVDGGVTGGRVETSTAATLSGQIQGAVLVLEVSPDQERPLRIELENLPGLVTAGTLQATLDGVALTGGALAQSASELELRIPHGGTVVVRPATS